MHDALLRIFDVNLNRASEALRVIEDHARFVLDDADAAAAAKALRHDLSTMRTALGAAALLAARDIVGDIGRDAKSPAELQRISPGDVLRAAFGRLGEAARSLGEYVKLVDAASAATAERIRYAAYELEQRVVLRGEPRSRFGRVRLYVILTEALCKRGWLEAAAAALDGGASCLQLREKSLPDAELLARARRLRELTAARGALLIINDRPDIARLSAADGIHVGQGDLSVQEARRIAGADRLVGKSTHTLEQLEATLLELPDYVAVGPMYPTSTKPQTHIAGPPMLAAAAQRTALPLVAIGGITTENVGPLVRANPACICVCSAVISAADPAAATAAILGEISKSAIERPQLGDT